MPQIKFYSLPSDQAPKEVLGADFPRLVSLPISGGWGYDQETACIIERGDKSQGSWPPVDITGVERVFIEHRLYEELIVFRPPGSRYSGIKWDITFQKLMVISGRRYDVLTVEVSALPEREFEKLKAEYEGPDGISSSDFDIVAHMKRHEALTHTAIREYWFDITS